MELFDPERLSCISFCVSFHFEEEMEVGVLRLELGAEVLEGWLFSNNGSLKCYHFTCIDQ